jgi:hypothetical protein
LDERRCYLAIEVKTHGGSGYLPKDQAFWDCTHGRIALFTRFRSASKSPFTPAFSRNSFPTYVILTIDPKTDGHDERPHQ